MSAGRVDKAWEILQAQQASMAAAESVQKAQIEKKLEKDLIMAEESHVSAIIVPPSTAWTSPQLVKSSYTGQAPATEAAKEMAKLPPPPPSMQHFWSAYYQMKGTSLPAEAYVGGKAPTAPAVATSELETLGEAEFAKISAAIHKESTSLINQSLEEAQEQQTTAMQKLEEISNVAADVENSLNTLETLEEYLQQYKINGQIAGSAYSKLKKLMSGISNAFKNGDIRFHRYSQAKTAGQNNFYTTLTSINELFTHLNNPQGTFGSWCSIEWSVSRKNLNPSIASFFVKIIDGPHNSQNPFWKLKESMLSELAQYSKYKALIHTYEGSLRNKFVIPSGHTATFMKNFPEPTYVILTNSHGTKEIAYQTDAKVTQTHTWKTTERVPGYWTTVTHATKVNIFTYFCKQHGIPIPLQPTKQQSYIPMGSIGKVPAASELYYQKGLELAQLMGYTGVTITPDEIQQALEIAKKVQMVLKKLMEAYYDQGNGLAVFTAYQNALSQGQQQVQQAVAKSEQSTSDMNLQNLNQLQSYVQYESHLLNELDNQTAAVEADQAELSKLSRVSQDLQYASYTMLGLSLLTTIGNFFTGGMLSIACIGVDIGSAAIALTSAGLQIAMGAETTKLGNDTVILANLQKQYAGAQEYVQEAEAQSNLTSQMASTTTATLQEIVQRQIDIEKDVMSMFDSASQAITASSQA